MAFLRVRSASDAAVQSVRYWFLLTPRDARAHMRDPGISVLVKKVNWFNSRLSFMRLLMFLLVKTPGKNRRHSKNKIRQRPCMFVDY